MQKPKRGERKPYWLVEHCYQCGKPIRSKYDYVMQWEGHDRYFHKSCAEMLLDELAQERASNENAR